MIKFLKKHYLTIAVICVLSWIIQEPVSAAQTVTNALDQVESAGTDISVFVNEIGK